MTDSRTKGKNGELQLARRLRELGFTDARRGHGQGAGGSVSEADVVGLPGVHIECKRYKIMYPGLLQKALGQAAASAKPDETPIVMHRDDHGPWLVTSRKGNTFVTMPLESWVEWYSKEYLPIIMKEE